MFKNYSIKKINNEEVLYLFVDMNYEFGKIGSKKKKESFMDKVFDYVNVNKINFHGVKIVIVIGGLVLGTFFLTTNLNNINVTHADKKVYVDKAYLNTYNEKNEIFDITEVTPQESDKIEQKYSSEKEIHQEIPVSNQNTNNNSTVNNNSTNKPNSSNNQVNNNSNTNATSPSSDVPVEMKTMVTVYRSSGVIQEIELEEYVIGVVGAEMPASFNIEALKVQAIIARTYALRAMTIGKALTDTVSTQAYKDNSQLKALWGATYNTYYNKIRDAVLATKGMKITHNGKLIEALYFSCGNGYTEDAVNVWGNTVSYLQSVPSNWDTNSSQYWKEIIFTYNDLSKIMGFDIDIDTYFSINSRNSSNRVSSVSVGSMNYSGVELRSKIGLRSTDFDIEIMNDGVKFITRGYGHGVGLSQYGAQGMASAGYNYNQIINYYYLGVSIVK